MSGGPTIVVKFGADVASDAVCVGRLDTVLNVDADGNAKTQFFPGEPAWLWVHFDPLKLRIGDIRATAGDVWVQGPCTRTETEDLLFEVLSEAKELGLIPSDSGSVAVEWLQMGRTSGISVTGRMVKITDDYPCRGKVSYPFWAMLCGYTPPALELAADEQWQADVVIYMENVA